MDSLSDKQTYCFADDILPYLGAFRGKRAYALLFKGKEIPVKDWNDFSGHISALLTKCAPEWLRQNASRYGWVSLAELGNPDLYLCPSVTNAYNAIKKLRTMLSEAGIPLADVSVVYGERSAARKKMQSGEVEKTVADVDSVAEESSCAVPEEENRLSAAHSELLAHLQVYNFLKPSDVFAMITLVLNRWKVRPESSAKTAVAKALDENWCVSNLKIKGPLLKQLLEGEEAPAVDSGFTVFSSLHNRFLLNRDHPNVDVRALSLWALDAEVPLVRICALLNGKRICALLKSKEKADITFEHCPTPSFGGYVSRDWEEEGRKRMEFLQNAQWMQEVRNEGEKVLREDMDTVRGQKKLSTQEIASMFKDDVKANYPTGLDFKESSVRLVEGRIGVDIGPSLIAGWKLEMFERPDGLYFFPDMIVDEATRGRMLTRAGELLSNEGMFALDALRAEFVGMMQNISDAGDFKAYFNQFIAEKIGGKVRGHTGWQMCFPESMDEEDGWNAVASRVREMLVGMGDAVSINDLEAQLPMLNREIIERAGKDRIADAVSFEIDGVPYLKLLEAYYLPDDFGAALSEFIRMTEANRSVASIVLIEGMLNERYGESFRTNYGLDDESVFKQVVAKSTGLDGYEWKRDMYVGREQRSKANVAEMFLMTHEGLFHEEEFFKFAEESRGMTNRGMLICTFLRKYCIRMSKDWWLSTKAFDEKFSLSEEQYLQIGDCLNNVVSGKGIYPIANLPQSALESLPQLQTNDRRFDWNPYLLTSVAVARVKNATVVNDDPSPYTVTAFVVPPDVERPSDVVEYALGTMPKGYFADAEAAFQYLKANNIRMTRTDKLMSKISDFLGC